MPRKRLVSCTGIQLYISARKKIQLLPGLDKQLIDSSADPCVNFWQYACGNFNKLYPIPAGQVTLWISFSIVNDYTLTVLHNMLDTVAAPSAQHTPNEQKIGDYYASCMDEDAIDADGLKPLQPELDRIAAVHDQKRLTELLAHYQMINDKAFFNLASSRTSRTRKNRLPWSIRGAWACRSAITTSAPAMPRRKHARNMSSTSRRCWF